MPHSTIDRNGEDLQGRSAGRPAARRRADRRFERLLLSGTALAALVLGGVVATPQSALAQEECGGVDETVTCIGSFFPGEPAGNDNGGIEYDPSGLPSFTLDIGDGTGTAAGAASVIPPPAPVITLLGTFEIGQAGVLVADYLEVDDIFLVSSTAIIPFGGVDTSVELNLNHPSQITGSSYGAFVWTEGAGNDAVINNYTSVLATGEGDTISVGGFNIGSPGIGLSAYAGSGNAVVHNYHEVNADGNAVNVYNNSGSGTAIAHNYEGATLTSDNGHGIATTDPFTGLIPTFGDVEITNDGSIKAGGTGIYALAGGDVTIVNSSMDSIDAGTGGIFSLSLGGGTVEVDNTGGSVNTESGAGIFGGSLGGEVTIDSTEGSDLGEVHSENGPGIVGVSIGDNVTIDSGKVSAGSDGVLPPQLVGLLPALPGPLGAFDPTSGGVIGISVGGDATVTSYGTTDVDGGTFGLAAISAGGAATTTALDDVGLNSPLIGMASIVIGGTSDATVTVDPGLTVTADLIGLLGVNAGAGHVIIDSTGADVVQNDPGLLNAGIAGAALGGGNVTIDAGTVTAAGSGAVGLSLGGDATVNLHEDVMADGLFGGAAISATGSATVWSAAGIEIDPLIGMAAIAAGPATVNNNAATVDADLIGLLGISFADSTTITSTGSVVTAPIAVSGAAALDTHATNTDGGIWNGSVVLISGRDSILDNLDDSEINIPGPGAEVLLAGRDAIINNTGSSIDFAGPLSFNLMAAGRDAAINNTSGSIFSMNGPASASLMLAGNDATITNDTGSTFSFDGAFTGNVMVAGNDATITNDRGSDFSMAGGINGNFMGAGNDATIWNDRGGSFSMLDGINGNFMFAGNDAAIWNDRGGSFTMAGLANGNFMFAGGDANIWNDRGGSFTMAGLTSGNFMFAGEDATIWNDRGSSFLMADLVDANVMIAGEDASIINDRGSSFTIAGLLNGNVMAALNGDATIVNDRGSDFTLAGITGQVIVADEDVSIDNMRGSTFTIAGVSGDLLVALGGDATIDNSATFNLLGLNVLGFVTPNGASTFTNDGLLRVQGVTALLGLDDLDNNNLITMADGDTNDVLFTTGNYTGNSQLEVDAFLAAGGDPDGDADLMIAIGDINGSTGTVVRKLNEVPGGINQDGIPVVIHAGDVENPCVGLCRLGDGFFIDPDSDNYINVGGVGLVQDGFFAWGMRHDDTEVPPPLDILTDFLGLEFEQFELISDWGPHAYQTPGLITAAQNVWYESTSVVEDHIHGLRFPSAPTMALAADIPQIDGKYPAPPPEPVAEPARSAGWIKGYGAWTDQKTSVHQAFAGTGTVLEFDTGFKQDTWGVMGGFDFGNEIAPHQMFRFGVFAGYTESEQRFKQWGTKADFSGPLVGAYASFATGGFYADAMVRADFLDMDYSAPLGFGFMGTKVDATSIGVMANVGHRWEMGDGFIEPVASFAYVNSDIDSFTAGGARVDFSDTDSLRLGGGARVGGSIPMGAHILEGSILGKVWHEFDDNETTLTDSASGAVAVFTDDAKGTFGEVAGQLTLFNMERTMSAFVSGGAKFNSDFTTWGAKGGVRAAF